MSALSPAMNTSWNDANNICISYNATLPSFSGHNDVLIIQAFLWDILNEALPVPIFLGLKKDFQVYMKNLYKSPIFLTYENSQDIIMEYMLKDKSSFRC